MKSPILGLLNGHMQRDKVPANLITSLREAVLRWNSSFLRRHFDSYVLSLPLIKAGRPQVQSYRDTEVRLR